jgi:phospholipid/cholesterol/gamma-HCH transport system substrate-binding protein
VTISKEVKVGALAIISGVMLYSGFNFLKGTDFFSSVKRYKVVYENVGGVKVSSPVMIKGLNVGRVERMVSLPDQDYKTMVIIQVDKSYAISSNSHLDIVELGLLDGKALELVMKDGGKILEDGDTLKGMVMPGMISAMSQKFSPLVSNIDTSLNKVKHILGAVEEQKINQILASLDLASKELYLTIKQSKTSIAEVSGSVSSKLDKVEKDLSIITTSLKSVGDSLNKAEIAKTVNNANKTLAETKELVARINSGQGSLGKLTKNDSLYANLNNSAADLDKLLIDLREHPNRYVHFSLFGRKEKPAKDTSKKGSK